MRSDSLARAEASMARKRLAPVRLEGLRVLLVDDEDDIRRALAILLRNAGVEVSSAGSTREALLQVAAHRPQVMVSDIGMPGEEGYSLVRQLRRAGHSAKDLPAIALTAFGREEDRERAMAAGFQVHLRKPMTWQELIVVIARVAGIGLRDVLGRGGGN